MVDIVKELSDNQTVLLLVPSTDYNNVTLDTVKKLSNESVGYVTLNKTFDSLKETFSKKGVNLKNIVFVDAITRTIEEAKDTDNCYFVNSPGALTELSLTISKFLRHNFHYIIFDSITNLLIYSKKAPVAMFLSSIVNKIKASKTKAVFYALSIKEQDTLIKESSMFVDKVVDLGKKQ